MLFVVLAGVVLWNRFAIDSSGLIPKLVQRAEVSNDTPMEVFNTYTKALHENDGKKFVKCLDSNLVNLHIGEVVLLHQPRLADFESSSKPEIRKQAAQHRAFYKKHGMDVHPRMIRRKLFLHGGSRTMLAEYVDLLKTAPLGNQLPKKRLVLKAEDLQVDGNTAVGTIRWPDQTNKGWEKVRTFAFKKSLTAGWRLSGIENDRVRNTINSSDDNR